MWRFVFWKWKWRDIWPSMVTHTWILCSAFNPSKVHTQQWTHTPWNNPSSGQPFMLRCPGRGFDGFSRAPQSWYWEWREPLPHSLPTCNSCQTWDLNSQPLDYKSYSLTITVRSHRRRRERQNSPWPPCQQCCRKIRGRSAALTLIECLSCIYKEPQSKHAHWSCADWPQVEYRLTSWNI